MVDRDVSRTRRVVVRHAITPPPSAEPTTGIPASRTAPEPTPEPTAQPTTEPTAPTTPEPAAQPTPEPASQPTPEPASTAEPEPAAPALPAAAAPDADRAAPAPVPTPAPAPVRGEESPYAFPTEALLDNHTAAADALRADLERLRRQLDDGPPPLPPVRRRNRKPLLGALVVGGTLAAIGTAVLIPWSDLGVGSSSAPVTAGPAEGNPARPGVVAAAAPAPRPAPAGSLPATGPGIDEPGTMMVVQVAKNGALNVTEQAVLGPQGLRELNLRLPSMAALGGQVAELAPTVHNLRVAVNGTPVVATPTADGPGWAVVAAGPERARTVQLSYQIQDAIVRTEPSSSGRALGVSLPLLGQALREQGLPLMVRAEGTAVGGATCPSAPTTKMLCGEEVDNGWLATIPAEASSPTLLLQLNLK